MIITIIVFIVILGLLVFVHEFGHFYAAKKSGMRVLEFGFGFPPRLIGLQKVDGKWKVIFGHPKSSSNQTVEQAGQAPSDSTIYSINAIPLGGFVKIWGENNEHEEDPRSFINRPFWARFATLIAGVTMNWLLGAVLFSLILIVGFKVPTDAKITLPKAAIVSESQIIIDQVLKGTPAAGAGLKAGDVILSVDSTAFENVDKIREYLLENKGKVFSFRIERGSEVKAVEVSSIANPTENQGPTGIVIGDFKKVRVPFFAGVKAGFVNTAKLTGEIFVGLGKLFYSKDALSQVGGPVKIGQLVGEARHYGFLALAEFTAFISVNLAIFNLLPIPALDGGRLLFLIIEKIRGKKNNRSIEQKAIAWSMAVLLILIFLVTIKDVKGF